MLSRARGGARTVGRMLTHVAIAPTRLWQGMHGTRSTDMTGFDFFGLGARMQAESDAAHERRSSSC